MTLFFVYMIHFVTMSLQAAGLVRSVQRGRIYMAFFAGLLLYQALAALSLPYFLVEFGVEVLVIGEIVAFVGTVAMLMTVETIESLFRPDRLSRQTNYFEVVLNDPRRYLIICGVSVIVILLITASRGAAVIDSNWEASRASLGLLDSVATLLQFLAFPAAWLLFRMGNRMLAILALILAFALFAVYGSRAALLTIPTAIGLDFYYRGVILDRRQLFVGGAFVFLLVIVLHVGGRIVRGLGVGGLLSVAQGDFTSVASLFEDPGQIDWTGGESSITAYYLFVIREGSIHGVESLATVIRWLTMYLPRFVAEDLKPMDPTYMLWLHAANAGVFETYDAIDRILEILRQGDTGSVHALFWGEAWMNGGVFALFTMCVVLGTILVSVEALYKVLPATVVLLMSPATIIGYLMAARGNSVIGLSFIAYLLLPAVIGYLSLAIFDRLFLSSARRHDVAQ